MSTNSTNKALLLPAQGDLSGSWGTAVTGQTFAPIDACFGNQISISLTSTDHTVTTSETQAPIHNASGTLSGNVNIVYPIVAGGYYIVENGTSGAFTVTAKFSGGTGVIVPQSSRALIKSDPSETAVKFAAAPDVLSTEGDLLYYHSSTYARLAIGGNGAVLQSNGTDPAWLALGTAGQVLVSNGTTSVWSSAPSIPAPLTDGATVSMGAATGAPLTLYRLTTTQNPAISAPTSPADGQRLILEITASGGSRSPTLVTTSGNFKFGTDITGIPTITSGTTLEITCLYNLSANFWRVLATANGY